MFSDECILKQKLGTSSTMEMTRNGVSCGPGFVEVKLSTMYSSKAEAINEFKKIKYVLNNYKHMTPSIRFKTNISNKLYDWFNYESMVINAKYAGMNTIDLYLIIYSNFYENYIISEKPFEFKFYNEALTLTNHIIVLGEVTYNMNESL